MTSVETSCLCLGCGQPVEADVTSHCPGFSVACHTELDQLSIAHVDCDAFFASVEKRDNPSLKHKPVVVGGRERGVVAAACYIARSYGIRSAMPSFQARKLCPEAVFVTSNFGAYREASLGMRAAMDALTPLVQQVSIDEAYLDLSGTTRLHGRSPAASLIHLQRQIEREIGVTVSVGLSHNKALAKMASELNKPRGFAIIGKEETLRFLATKPVETIQGVGKRFAQTLKADGLATIGDLQHKDQRWLVDRYGEHGLRLYSLSRGKDNRPVRTNRQVKSISGETTFSVDLATKDALEDKLYAMCQKVSSRAKAKNYAGFVVTLKLKTNTFRSLTRRKTLGVATNIADILFRIGCELLAEQRKAHPRQAYRLLGIGISELVPAESMHLDLAYPEEHTRLKRKEDAIDALRHRFGEGVIGTMRDKRIIKR